MVQVLLPALLQVAMIVMMVIRTSLLAARILNRVSHLFYHDVAPAWACIFHVFFRHCPLMSQLCMYTMYCLVVCLGMYVLYCPIVGFDVLYYLSVA